MSSANFDDYESLLFNLNPDENQQDRTQLFLNQQQQQQQQQQQHLQYNQTTTTTTSQLPSVSQPRSNIQTASHVFDDTQSQNQDNTSQFGSYVSNSSHYGSEVNFTGLNDAVSSLNSGLLSPYSTGSSPDDFFLSAGNSQAGSQYGQAEGDFNVDLNNNHLQHDVLYPNQFIPVPMAESASNSTVTFNTHEYQSAQQIVPTLKTVEEAEEEYIKKESPDDISKLKNQLNQSTQSLQSFESSQTDDLQQPRVGNRKIKSSHNLIEKKYRTNINSKIIELRNCVPSLRILVAKNGNHRTNTVNNEAEDEEDYYEGNGYSDDEEKLDGLKPAKKLNKATILAKASEYIRHLEKKTEFLREQNIRLQNILENSNFNAEPLLHQQNFQQPQPQYYHSQSTSMHSSPFNRSNNSNSTSNRGSSNLVSPNDMNFQNQQLPDHQSLTNKLMMGGIGGMFGVSAMDDLTNGSSMNQRNLFALPVFSFTSGSTASATATASSTILLCFIKLAITAYIFKTYFLVDLQSHYSSFKKLQRSNNMSKTATLKRIISKSIRLTYTDSEKILLDSLKSTVSNSELISSALRTMQLPNTSKNSLLKAAYVSRIIESVKRNNVLAFKANICFLQKLGRNYWSKALPYLLENDMNEYTDMQFENFNLYSIFKMSGKHGNFTRLDDILLYGLIDELFTSSMRKSVNLSALRMECSQYQNGSTVLATQIIDLQNDLWSDLMRLSKFQIFKDIQMKCQLMQSFVTLDVALLRSSVENLELSRTLIEEVDIKTALLCCILKHHLTGNSDISTIYKSICKLKFPKVSERKLSTFQFISLMSVMPFLNFKTIESINEFVSATDNNKNINKQLINMLGHMRVYLGSNLCDSLDLSLQLQKSIINSLVVYMNEIDQL